MLKINIAGPCNSGKTRMAITNAVMFAVQKGIRNIVTINTDMAEQVVDAYINDLKSTIKGSEQIILHSYDGAKVTSELKLFLEERGLDAGSAIPIWDLDIASMSQMNQVSSVHTELFGDDIPVIYTQQLHRPVSVK